MFNYLFAYLHARVPTTLNREEGQTMAEYGVVLAVITIAAVGAFLLLGDKIEEIVKLVTTKLKSS